MMLSIDFLGKLFCHMYLEKIEISIVTKLTVVSLSKFIAMIDNAIELRVVVSSLVRMSPRP